MDEQTFVKELEMYNQKLRESEELIARLQKEMQAFAKEAIHDRETALYSHAYFQARLGEEVVRSERYRHFLSLILVHVNLKNSNSTGQVTRELRKIGRQLAGGLTRRTDTIALYRKRQMVIMLPETDNHGAHKLILRFQATFPCNGRRMSYTTMTYPNDASNIELVLTLLQHNSESLFRGGGLEKNK